MFGANTVSKSIKLIELALNNVVAPRARQIHILQISFLQLYFFLI